MEKRRGGGGEEHHRQDRDSYLGSMFSELLSGLGSSPERAKELLAGLTLGCTCYAAFYAYVSRRVLVSVFSKVHLSLPSLYFWVFLHYSAQHLTSTRPSPLHVYELRLRGWEGPSHGERVSYCPSSLFRFPLTDGCRPFASRRDHHHLASSPNACANQRVGVKEAGLGSNVLGGYGIHRGGGPRGGRHLAKPLEFRHSRDPLRSEVEPRRVDHRDEGHKVPLRQLLVLPHRGRRPWGIPVCQALPRTRGLGTPRCVRGVSGQDLPPGHVLRLCSFHGGRAPHIDLGPGNNRLAAKD